MSTGVGLEPGAGGRSWGCHDSGLRLGIGGGDGGGLRYGGMRVERGSLGIGVGHEGGRGDPGGVAVARGVGGGWLEGSVAIGAVRGEAGARKSGSRRCHSHFRSQLRCLTVASANHRGELSLLVLAKLGSHHRPRYSRRRMAERDGASLRGGVEPGSLEAVGNHDGVVLRAHHRCLGGVQERGRGHAGLIRDKREGDYIGAQFREGAGAFPGGLDGRVQRSHNLSVAELGIQFVHGRRGLATRERRRIATPHCYPAVWCVTQLKFVGPRAYGGVSEVREGRWLVLFERGQFLLVALITACQRGAGVIGVLGQRRRGGEGRKGEGRKGEGRGENCK